MLATISLMDENTPLVLSSDADVDEAEAELGLRFPSGYREYVTRLGEGLLHGAYLRVYPPRRILSGSNNHTQWRERIAKYWFWDEGVDKLPKDRALECVIIADTYQGDELVVHPDEPEKIYVLPRHSEDIHVAGEGLFDAIEWLCSSGVLSEPAQERMFEPFDSRGKA